jgi:hypothetical protein
MLSFPPASENRRWRALVRRAAEPIAVGCRAEDARAASRPRDTGDDEEALFGPAARKQPRSSSLAAGYEDRRRALLTARPRRGPSARSSRFRGRRSEEPRRPFDLAGAPRGPFHRRADGRGAASTRESERADLSFGRACCNPGRSRFFSIERLPFRDGRRDRERRGSTRGGGSALEEGDALVASLRRPSRWRSPTAESAPVWIGVGARTFLSFRRTWAPSWTRESGSAKSLAEEHPRQDSRG